MRYTLHANAEAEPFATVPVGDAPRVISALIGRDPAMVAYLLGRRYMRTNPVTGLRSVYIAGRKGHRGVVVRQEATS